MPRNFGKSSVVYTFDGLGAQFGYYTDLETGLILCTHRYYDASAGRWLNRDPIGYEGGINLYGYVKNNPIIAADPDGTDIIIITPGKSKSERQAIVAKINIALAKIKSTKHGKMMLDQVDGTLKTGRDLRITWSPGLGNCFGRKVKRPHSLIEDGYIKISPEIINSVQLQFKNPGKKGLFFDHAPLRRWLPTRWDTP